MKTCFKIIPPVLKSVRGSALGLIIAGMGVLGIATVGTIGISNYLSKAAASDTEARDIDTFAQALENLITNSTTCYGTVSGLPRTSPTPAETSTDFSGLKFYPAAGGTASRAGFIPTATTQDVLISGVMTNSGGNKEVAKNLSFPTANVLVNNLYIKNVQAVPAMVNSFTADLYLEASVISNSSRQFAPRLISSLLFKTDGANTLLGCTGKIPAQTMCEQMGCRFNPADLVQKCNCGFPDMDCNEGIAADAPRRYLAGYDAATNTKICKSLEISCESKGAGYFMVGMDSYGQPICLTLESNTTAPTTTTVTTTTLLAATTTTLRTGPGCACSESRTGGGRGGAGETSGSCEWVADPRGYCEEVRRNGGGSINCSAYANPARCGGATTTTTIRRIPLCYSKDWGFQASPHDCDTVIHWTRSAACPKPASVRTGFCGHLDSSCDPVYPGDPFASRCPP